MKKIGIIGAMEVEIASLKSAMKVSRMLKKAQMEFLEGELEGPPKATSVSLHLLGPALTQSPGG